MIKIVLTLDYESFDKFWESFCGDKVEEIILNSHCISWSGEEVPEQ